MYRGMFGYQSNNLASVRAYDMMVLDQIEKDEKELKLREMYGEDTIEEEVSIDD